MPRNNIDPNPHSRDHHHHHYHDYPPRPASSTSSTHPMLQPPDGAARSTSAVSSSSNNNRATTPSSRSFLTSAATASPSSLLSVNYVPSKFSQSILLPDALGPYRRRKRVGANNLNAGGREQHQQFPMKMGGGVEAFRSGEARIGGSYDDDEGVALRGMSYAGKKRSRWTKFKWALFIANTVLTLYSIAGLVSLLLIWFNVFHHSQVIVAANKPELILSTVAASLGILTSTIGWAGILLNNRCFLATYTFLLWLVFAALVAPGYLSYKHRTFNLDGKLNELWSRDLDTAARLLIQNDLGCCGYFDPFAEATLSATCYSRTVLKGCKSPLMAFQKVLLKNWYTGAFGLVPLHIFVMTAGLLCSNHVTYRFGKGMMPKAYRLDMNALAIIMDNYASELAEIYGAEIADAVMEKSRSNLNLSSMSTMPFVSSSASPTSTPRRSKVRYDSISSRGPEALEQL